MNTKERETVYELPVKFTQAVELTPVSPLKNTHPPAIRSAESVLLPNFSPGAVLPVRGPGIVVEGGPNDNKICLDRLREAQAQDGVCQEVMTWFDRQTGVRKSDRELKVIWANRMEEEADIHPERNAFRQVRANLILTEPPPAARATSSGKLLAFQELLGDRIRVRYVVPHIFRQQVIDKSHTRGHRGRQRTIEAIKSGFYWPTLEVDVNTFINRCMGCLVRNKPNLKVGIHRPVERFSVGETVCLDMLGPFPESASGNTLVLSILDLGSRYAKLVPLKDKKATTVLTAFKREWLQGEGSLPSQVLCDRGMEFASEFSRKFWRDFDIRVKFAHPGNHQTLPVERLHRTIMSMVRSLRVDGERDWEEAISIATSLYNTSIHSSTGCSPNLLYYGREKPLPGFNLLHDYNQGLGEGEPTLLAQRQADLMNRIIAISGQETTRMFKANARAYGGRSNRYSPGDVVFAWTEGPRLGGDHIPSRKLRVKWSGPFVVVERLNENMVLLGELTDRSTRVRDPQNFGKVFPSHFSRLVLHRTAAEVMAGNQIHPLTKLPNLNSEEREELESAASTWETIVPYQFHPQVLDEVVPEGAESNSESDLEGELWVPEERGAPGPYIPPFLGEAKGEVQGPFEGGLGENEKRGPQSPYIPPFLGEKRGEVQGPFKVGVGETEKRGPQDPYILPFLKGQREGIQGPSAPYWAPRMTQVNYQPKNEILGPNYLPMEIGLEVNEREKLKFRGLGRGGQPTEGEGMGLNPDPLEQYLPDMGVVCKRDCEDRLIQAPGGQMERWRDERDQMVEGGVMDLPDRVHEAQIYPPKRATNRQGGPRRRDQRYGGDMMWEDGAVDLPHRGHEGPMLPSTIGRYQNKDLKGKGLEYSRMDQNRGLMNENFNHGNQLQGELMPPETPPQVQRERLMPPPPPSASRGTKGWAVSSAKACRTQGINAPKRTTAIRRTGRAKNAR